VAPATNAPIAATVRVVRALRALDHRLPANIEITNNSTPSPTTNHTVTLVEHGHSAWPDRRPERVLREPRHADRGRDRRRRDRHVLSDEAAEVRCEMPRANGPAAALAGPGACDAAVTHELTALAAAG